MSSADPLEMAKFEKLADTWWDDTGPFWPLHRLNTIRSGYIVQALSDHFGFDPHDEQPLADLRVLDIGCGGGLLSEAMARLGATVLGIDVVERNILIARRHQPEHLDNLRYEHVSVESLAADGAQFDVVLNMEVVEHVADLPTFVAACCRLVRPGGVTIVATLNRNPLSFITAIVGAEYILRWLPRGTHDWRKFPKPAELDGMLRQGGLRVIASKGVRVNPLNRKFSLTDSLAINYMLVATTDDAAA